MTLVVNIGVQPVSPPELGPTPGTLRTPEASLSLWGTDCFSPRRNSTLSEVTGSREPWVWAGAQGDPDIPPKALVSWTYCWGDCLLPSEEASSLQTETSTSNVFLDSFIKYKKC